ncbi:hypothetical protein quinque_014530 [Culex quinquefasciatus]
MSIDDLWSKIEAKLDNFKQDLDKRIDGLEDSWQHRNAFYASYLNHRDLNLSHIGFQNTNRIYVNENLTKEDREIRAAALRLKKEGKVQKVYSRNGIVYAKGRGNAPAEPCPTLEHLAVFR